MPGGQNAMAHLKKRKLEAESNVLKLIQPSTSPLNGKKHQHQIQSCGPVIGHLSEMESPDMAMKRRRKTVRDDDIRKTIDSEKPMVLPQKKRVFTTGNSGSPARKSSKKIEDPEDDETLIRETEAALKSLSGSWPGPSGSLYQRGNSDEDRYESNFENLFEEKKDNPKLSPSSISTSSTTSNEAGCSLKDVITFRGQHDRRSFQQHRHLDSHKQLHQQIKSKKDVDSPTQIESDSVSMQCQSSSIDTNKIRSLTRVMGKDRSDRLSDQVRDNEKFSRYDAPDFDELVDDSSNELEIDMSDPLVDKDEDRDHRSEDRDKNCAGKNNLSTQNSLRNHSQQIYSNYQRYPESNMKVSSITTSGSSLSTSTSPAFSGTSAFRPPITDNSKASCRTTVAASSTSSPPIGPYPASATFVSFPLPIPGPAMPAPQPVIPSSIQDKHSSVSLLQLKSPKEDHHNQRNVSTSNILSLNKTTGTGLPSVGSPDANASKQYTILQPAGVGSRAASAIQDVAREGVASVAAVTSSNNGSSSSSSSSTTNTSTNSYTSPKTANSSQVNSNRNSASMMSNITTNTTTSTTICSTAVDDLSTSSLTNQDDVMKMADQNTFDETRPGMSMSPSSLSRGEGCIKN